MSHQTRRAGKMAALASAAAMLLSGCDFSIYSLPLPGGPDVGDNPVRVTAQFRDVLDLVPQSTVKVDDVTVGKVETVELDGYAAKVTLLLRRDVQLPDNTQAEIRQTSLLGEKFVSLKPPADEPAEGELGDGDVIELADTGRNTEVEEVLGALSLVLNGGGVAQLKTITEELNKALGGREDDIKSVLNELGIFMGQLDDNKQRIITAIDRLNSLSVSVNDHSDDLKLALDELPAAIDSVDRQRDDLVKMLTALNKLGKVGTKVIKASKQGTVDSLNALAPTLTELAKSGDDLVNSLQIVLTHPFIDGVVGKNPAQARDLHMGDYTNLSIVLDLDLSNGIPGIGNPEGGDGTPSIPLPTLPVPSVALPTIGAPGLGGGSINGDSGGGLGDIFPSLPGLGRAAVGQQPERDEARADGVDTGLGALLVWGALKR